jgi:fatty acid desaturase
MTTTSGEEFREVTREGLSPAEVRELSQLNALRATLPILESFGLIAIAAAVSVRWHFAVPISLLLVAAGQHGLAVLAHEAAHYRLYKTRWLNDLVGKICGAPLGVSMLTYRIIHRIHHNHLYQEIDPDLALMAGYPRGRLYLAKKLLKDLTGITIVKNYRYFKGRQAKRPGDDTSSNLRRAARRDRRIVLGVQLLILTIAIATGVWRWYLLLWILPLVTLLQAILRLRAVCEHGAVSDLTTPLRAARTTLVPIWARWILFPHNVYFHVEHHLYPSVPHYRLAECHRRLQKAGALDDAEVVPTLGGTLRKIFAPQGANTVTPLAVAK